MERSFRVNVWWYSKTSHRAGVATAATKPKHACTQKPPIRQSLARPGERLEALTLARAAAPPSPALQPTGLLHDG